MIGLSADQLIGPADPTVAQAVLGSDWPLNVDSERTEHRIVRPDGTGVWVTMNLATIDDVDLPMTIVVTTDVTEERQMLLDLARFRHLFEHSRDIITVVDAQGQVLYSSPSTERVLGYPYGFRHPEDQPRTGAELGQVIAGERGTEPTTFRIRTQSGEWRYFECVGVNLLDEPGVRGVVLTSRDVTDRQGLAEQLAHIAGHDHLTDLPNRSVIEPRLEQALARAVRGAGELCVGLCYIDLDGFKRVNDSLGHEVGDSVIVEVADRICGIVRTGDTAIRIGGDESVVIFDPVSGMDDATEAARRVRDTLTSPPLRRDDVTVGGSVGAVSNRDDTPATLLKRADAALYRAKAQGDSTIAVEPVSPTS